MSSRTSELGVSLNRPPFVQPPSIHKDTACNQKLNI